MKKTKFIEDGYNLNKINDKIYYLDSEDLRYKEMTIEIYDSIKNNTLKII